MNGVNIGTFDPTVPSDAESAGLGDDRIRSTKTTFQQALDDEHVFGAAGGTVGQHRFGSARAYFGTQSRVSSSGTDGRLMQTSDTSRLFGVGSGGTVFYGGSRTLSVGSDADTAAGRHHWVEEFGEVVSGALGITGVPLPNSGFSGLPYIFCQAIPLGGNPFVVTVESRSATSFTAITWSETQGPTAVSGVTFQWRSLGTRCL